MLMIAEPKRAHRRAAVVVLGAVLLALVPAFVETSRAAAWGHRGLLAGLAALAAMEVVGQVTLKRPVPVRFDATELLIVVALIAGGPLPAFLILLIPDLLPRLVLKDRRLLTPGLAANLASYGCVVFAGAGMLALSEPVDATGGAPSAVALLLVLLAVSWLVARGIFGTLWQGYRFIDLLRDEYLSMVGSHVAVGVFAALVVALLHPLGFAVLYVIVPAIAIPHVMLPALARSRDIAHLDSASAARLYARALAAHVGVSWSQRRAALAAVALLEAPDRLADNVFDDGMRIGSVLLPSPPTPPDQRLAVSRSAWFTALHSRDFWNGDGQGEHDCDVRRELIPIESRLTAVACEWSKLTAAGGRALPQVQAALALEAQAGTRFDPSIVAAVSEIINTEAQFATLESFQPTLDLLPLPRSARRSLLPWTLRAYAASR